MSRPLQRIDDEPGKRGRGPSKSLLEATERELLRRLKAEKDPTKLDPLLRSSLRLVSAMLQAMGEAKRRAASSSFKGIPGARAAIGAQRDEDGELSAPDLSDLSFDEPKPKEASKK
ncbi:MAG: hypothetical protein ACRD52_00655 [Candidatus Acidiferrales bacterium]